MALASFDRALIVVRGGGDLASGVIYRLHKAGFPVMVTELEAPLFVRRTVSYGEAIYSGKVTIEGVTARRVFDTLQARNIQTRHEIPVIVDPTGESLAQLHPTVVIDARVAKVKLDTRLTDAPLVIALGPGFTAGIDCHAVIETQRGHFLGRVIYEGCAESDTGEPGSVNGHTYRRVLRATAEGHIRALAHIGDSLETGDPIAELPDGLLPAPFAGMLRGLIHERVVVTPGLKIGDLDPRAHREHCFTISDKSLSVGGGVLEAIFSSPEIRKVV